MVGEEDGHERDEQLLPHVRHRRVDLQQRQHEHIRAVLHRELEQILHLTVVPPLGQVQ